jgi:CheY-like chemotaxis protein
MLAEETRSRVEEQKSILGRRSLEVLTAETAEAALALLQESPVDLLLADLDLQKMGGDALCAAVKGGSNGGQRTYVILACSGKKSELERCGACGADAYIRRPIDPEALSARVSAILGLPERRATRVLVKVTVQGSYHSEPFYCTSEDISITGILLESDKSLARGDMIDCAFFLPESERITVSCEVMRIAKVREGKHHYGAVFVDILDDARKTIEEFIERERAAGNFK